MDSNPSSLINLVLNGAQTIVAKGTPDCLSHAAIPRSAHG